MLAVPPLYTSAPDAHAKLGSPTTAPRDAYECARAPSRRAVARRRGLAATAAPDTAAAQKE